MDILKIVKDILESLNVNIESKVTEFSIPKLNKKYFNAIDTISYNNEVDLFVDMKQLSELGINRRCDLKRKCIAYAIVLPNNRWIFGHTSDVGERVNTYAKDGRKLKKWEQQFYNDFKKYGRGLFLVLAVTDTKENARVIETNLISGTKKIIFNQITEDTINAYTSKQVMGIVGKYIYNINK